MVNTTTCNAWKATSNGAWAGDNPIHFALPLVIIQLCLILFISRLLSFLFRPLRQPRVIAEICGGVILGASAFGYIPHFTEKIFPPASLTVLTTLANLGLLFFLFMVGLELDLRSVAKTGKAALSIALAGVALPFGLGAAASVAIRNIMGLHSKFGPFLVFMGVAISITAFPVLARILAERKLLTTDVGQLAMAAAAVNDVLAWVLLALAVALAASGTSPAVVAWILLCGLAFVVIMFLVVRPFMVYLCSHIVDNEPIPEWIVATTLVGVLASAFTTDVIGIHGIFGAFVFGLIIPKDGPFAGMIIEKIEDLTTIVLLPLYFASSGLSVKLETIRDGKSVGVLFLVIGVACAGKIGGTFLVALLNKIPVRKALVLGFLMNTKGLVELIVLNIGLQKQVINQELYTIMVIMALVTTFMTTPLVMLLYEPAREKIPYTQTKVESNKDVDLRMLVCLHGMKTIPPVLNLMETIRGSRKRPLRAFMLHLVEFSERSSAIMMVTRVRKDGKPFWSKEAEREGRDQVAVAFRAYARLSKVQVQAMTAISGFFNMHEDVCSTAADKRANLIVLPYHKYRDPDSGQVIALTGFQTVNQRVMRSAPCSVAIFVDRGFGGSQTEPGKVAYRVAVVFFGGPDDREALALGTRMAEHPGLVVTVIQFEAKDGEEVAISVSEKAALGARSGEGPSETPEVTRGPAITRGNSFIIPSDKLEFDNEAKLDGAALAPVKTAAASNSLKEGSLKKNAVDDGTGAGEMLYEARLAEDAVSSALAVAGEGFDLIITGRGRRSSPLVALAQSGLARGSRRMEDIQGLGVVGDALVSLDADGEQLLPSILVVQQHDPSLVRPTRFGTSESLVSPRMAKVDETEGEGLVEEGSKPAASPDSGSF